MKKAELTTQQLIALIIIIASFVILIFFFVKLNLGDVSKKDVCRDSVIKQSNFAQKAFSGGYLDCRTEYICISGGEDCESGYDRKIELKFDNKEDEKKVFRVLAEEMANCWWMFGEGQIDYSGGNWMGEKTSCAICSVVLFDSKVKDKFLGDIPYSSFGNYLAVTNMKSSTNSYLNYLYSSNDVYEDISFYKGNIELKEAYVILTGITYSGTLSNFFNKGGGFSFPPLLLKRKDHSTLIPCNDFVTMA